MRKSAAVQWLKWHGVVKLFSGTQIRASIEALIKRARTPRGLIASRLCGKSKAA
jgi:hypothetical protein